MRTIPGLPTRWLAQTGAFIDLSRVPKGPTRKHDPNIAAKKAAWEAWYDEVLRYREQRQQQCVRDRHQQHVEYAMCAASSLYFITVWCSVYEERPGQSPLGVGWLPAIPQPFHVELLLWVERRWEKAGRGGRQGAISKSRDMGATWYLSLWMLHGVMFRKVFSAKVISRREELVDKIGDLDAVMERVASHLFADADGSCPLPAWLRPKGIDGDFKRYRQTLHITVPGSRNRIRGESTSPRSARGGRSGFGLIDEAAFIRILKSILAGVKEAVGCLILCSSESVELNETFVEYRETLKKLDPDYVLELDYWMHFYHDEAWLEMKEREDYPDDHDAFVREVLRDAYAGYSSWIYGEFRDREVGVGHFPWENPMPVYIGFDPAFDDESAAEWCAYDLPNERYRFIEGGVWRMNEPEFYAHIFAGMPELPGRNEPAYVFSEADYLLMEQTASWPAPIVCGDPSGTQRHGKVDDSFYDHLRRRYLLLTGHPLDIRVNWKNEVRRHQDRWNALRALLRRADFNDTAGVRHFIAAVRAYRLEEAGDRRLVSEQKAPRHNWASHPTTAGEFLAVNLDLIERLLATFGAAEGERADAPERMDVPERINVPERMDPMERVA